MFLQFFAGRTSLVLVILATLRNNVQCAPQLREPDGVIKRDSELDLEFSDTNHGEVTNTDQQVLYINHGSGATSSIRRNLVVPAQFSPHVASYPNSLFESNFAPPQQGPPFGPSGVHADNFAPPEHDVPRLLRRNGGGGAGARGPPQSLAQPQSPPPPDAFVYQSLPPPLPTPQRQTADTTAPPPPPPLAFPLAAGPSPHQQNLQHQQQGNQLGGGFGPPPPQPYLPGPQQPQFQPDFFNFFEAPFAPPTPLFQRRRLTVQNLSNMPLNDISHNAIGGGYPAYNYYKGLEDEASVKWPKIFKFTDGRINLSDFEKDKKLGKVKFAKKEPLFDNIRRDSFLILHGGTYS